MVAFDRTGTTAFIAMGREPTVQKVAVASRRVLLQRPGARALHALRDGDPRRLGPVPVHKAKGTVSVLSTQTLEPLVPEMTVGHRANHVEFVGGHAYVAVRGPPWTAPPWTHRERSSFWNSPATQRSARRPGPSSTASPT